MSEFIAFYIGGGLAAFMPLWFWADSEGADWRLACAASLFWPLAVVVIWRDRSQR